MGRLDPLVGRLDLRPAQDVAGPPGTRGPVGAAERHLAPDLARGAMLLLIALANAPVLLYDRPLSLRGHLAETGWADRLVTFATTAFVDGRAYPMFAALLGYGVVSIVRRQLGAGTTHAALRRLLRRRHLALLGIGLVHAVALLSGDVLGAYGLAGLVILTLLAMSNGRLLLTAAVLGIPFLAVGATYGVPPEPGATYLRSAAEPSALTAAALRLGEWLPATPVSALGMLVPICLGVWAGRRGYLDQPDRHLRALRWAAGLGVGVGVLGGIPFALVVAGALPTSSLGVDLGLAVLHTGTGVAGGLGLAALAGLVAARVTRADIPGRVIPVLIPVLIPGLAACGARSLSCYLAQSVVLVPLLSPWGLGLGARLGSAATALLAVATWLVTVLGAAWLARHGRRGPAEWLLRRIVYGRAASPSPAAPSSARS
ncbi:DUF418 domain-containing protein [Actinopolymorpha cephalotaxi]|uniref:Membrane protein YeiB n=1 Tax=Actinopolymorpha cephalotaxi TaxID=504797 RepID=A0ABX2S869_9ACTN|nr:DUF418 domain-containing protein [Actinopolymorpha cephalotaxi]NYH85805.1 putative membrane protein YeiB [Actinopolymorpha cephalotaxi]